MLSSEDIVSELWTSGSEFDAADSMENFSDPDSGTSLL